MLSAVCFVVDDGGGGVDRAAFQYGVKMSDGRKTRRAGPKDEKNKLDRELQQINRIMDKRKLPVTVAPSKRRKR